jgi:hypothetical protein
LYVAFPSGHWEVLIDLTSFLQYVGAAVGVGVVGVGVVGVGVGVGVGVHEGILGAGGYDTCEHATAETSQTDPVMSLSHSN